MEARAAAERRAVDDAVDAVAQQGCEEVLDGVQTRGRDLAAVRLNEAHVEIRNLVALRADLDVDEAHVGRLHGGMVQGEALHFCHELVPFGVVLPALLQTHERPEDLRILRVLLIHARQGRTCFT